MLTDAVCHADMMVGEVRLDLRPVAVIVADFLAPCAQRQHGRQLAHVLDGRVQFAIALIEKCDQYADKERDHEETDFEVRSGAARPGVYPAPLSRAPIV